MRILILCLMVAGACSRGEPSEPAEQAPEAAAEEPAKSDPNAPETDAPTQAVGQPAKAPDVDLDAPPTVELLDAGQAPHKALRTTFKPGTKQSLRIESDSTVETVYGPLIKTTAVMPSLVYELATEAKAAGAKGTLFTFKVVKVTATTRERVKPAQLEAISKISNSLEGATGSFSISPRGVVQDFAIDTDANASLLGSDMVDQIGRALRLSSLPLPEEPVGKGAKWTATEIVRQRTAGIRHITSFELVDVKGDTVSATITDSAETPAQPLKLPGRAGAPLALDGVDLNGGGKGTWPLDKFGPASASDRTSTVFKMTATAPRRELVIMALNTAIVVKAQP